MNAGGSGGVVDRTLLVGDEPRDIVFAGPGKKRAFITAAHRGQNVPFDPQFTTPGLGRADVWVFDSQNLGPSLGGAPLTIVTLFGDTPRGSVAPQHLNKHINYNACCAPTPNAESEKSLAQPTGMAVSGNGSTLYVAAFGSSKTEIGHVPMYDPEPASIVEGRQFFYDARRTSSHGDSSCASCHIFGDLDSLGWNLGNPDGSVFDDPTPIVPFLPPFDVLDPALGLPRTFHPMKGPMTTQSLRGMANHGPMHWRGDRTGSNDEPSAQPDEGAFDEDPAFKKFNPAFEGLLGRSQQLTDDERQTFTTFILQVMYPPNPVRNLDNSLTPHQQAGRYAYFDRTVAPNGACETCHRRAPKRANAISWRRAAAPSKSSAFSTSEAGASRPTTTRYRPSMMPCCARSFSRAEAR